MENLIKLLNKNIDFHQASTGTIYLKYKGKSIRIGNHERNFGAPRTKPDFEIFTHDIGGKQINDKYQTVEKVADFFEIQIKGTLKGLFTKDFNKKIKKDQELIKIMAKAEKNTMLLEIQQELLFNEIKKQTKNKEQTLFNIFVAAEKQGSLAANGKKRRKRRVSFFKKEFKKIFGIEASPYQVEKALNKSFRKEVLKKSL